MKDSEEQRKAHNRIKQIAIARNRWLDGEICDVELSQSIEYGKNEVSYELLQKHRLAREFDQLTQVTCAMELLQENPLGGDTTEAVRKFTTDLWEKYLDGDRSIDVASLFPDLK